MTVRVRGTNWRLAQLLTERAPEAPDVRVRVGLIVETGETVAEETWHEARLIPTSGINGADEQERRATSALLAVMTSVHQFGRLLTQPLGAPAGTIKTYIEVPFLHAEKRLFPDGLVRVSRGQRSWTTLVEVKTGTNALAAEQIENYLDIAREQGLTRLSRSRMSGTAKMRELNPEDVEPVPLASTALSSQDGAEVEQAPPSDSGIGIGSAQGSTG